MLNDPQPSPTQNDNPAVWDLVVEDMNQRNIIGTEKYGTPLQPHNGRDALVDAYKEALDLVVYLRQAIYERDEKSASVVNILQNYQDRVINEKKELDKKAKDLSEFIGNSPIFETIDPAEQERLKVQNDIMWQYSEVLGARIAAFVI